MPPGAEFAWAAFWRLHHDRPQMITSFVMPAGMGAVAIIEPRPGRIPFSTIDCYARRYGIEGSAFDRLLALITSLDNRYLAWDAARARDRAAARVADAH